MDEFWIILDQLIFIALMFFWMFPSLKRSLHMFQQNRYEIGRYQSWLDKNRKEVSKHVVLYLIGILFFFLLLFIQNLTLRNIVLSFMLAGFGYLLNRLESKKEYIKPLHKTSRVKRQFGVMILLNCLWLIPLSFFPLIRIVLAMLGYVINWMLIYPMAWITSPLEGLIKKFYINKAKTILKEMPHLIKIGITGSFGKTSSKNILQEILSEQFYSLMTPASFNTPMGITITIREQLKTVHQVFICEMGADHVDEIDFLTKFVQPQYGIVTSIGPQHLNTFGSLENIIHEKMKMIENLPVSGVGFLNRDNEYIRDYPIKNTCRIMWYGIQSIDVDYQAINIVYSPKGSHFEVLTKDGLKYPFQTRLLGAHNIANILAAISVARELKVDWKQLQSAVAQVKFIEHRLEIKKINQLTFIDNAFNSNPVGSAMSLDVMSMMPGNRIIVTPGMIDLGESQDEMNCQFGKLMLNKVDTVILVGINQTKPIYQGLVESGYLMENVHVVKTVKEAFALVYKIATLEDTILLENDLPDAFNN